MHATGAAFDCDRTDPLDPIIITGLLRKLQFKDGQKGEEGEKGQKGEKRKETQKG